MIPSDKRPMFPHTVDSTLLESFRSCPQKAFRTYFEHWKPKAESVHLVAGGAFARGVEVARRVYFVEGRSEPEAYGEGLAALIHHYGDFECPSDSAKSLERMCGALEFYFHSYPLSNDGMTPVEFADGAKAIEFSFANPLPVLHPETGDPILYTGRADAIMNFAGGIYVVDEKTTSQLGASWPRQWEMRGQFSGYSWAAREYGIEPAGTIIRGVSILKTKYDTLQSITYRPAWEIDRWLDQTIRDVRRMIRCWIDGHFDYSLGHACAEYGGCSLLQVCKSPDPNAWLPMYFEQRVWEPLAKRDLTVEEHEAAWGHKR